MAILHLSLKKIAADRAAFSCRRADGTVTWSRVKPFFPLHDLTHVAVESTLGFRRAFFGLIEEGWNLDDFAQPGVAARLPEEAQRAEVMVGVFDGLGFSPTHEAYTASLALALAGQGLPPYPVSHDTFAAICRRRAELQQRWLALSVGETLALDFSLP